jgi:hypothetical protein
LKLVEKGFGGVTVRISFHPLFIEVLIETIKALIERYYASTGMFPSSFH